MQSCGKQEPVIRPSTGPMRCGAGPLTMPPADDTAERRMSAHTPEIGPHTTISGRPVQQSYGPADLGEFDAETYPEKLEEWGRATLAAWMAAR